MAVPPRRRLDGRAAAPPRRRAPAAAADRRRAGAGRASSSRRPTACCSPPAPRREAAARAGIARMRFATSVDDDLRPFYDRFSRDPVIGRAVRSNPGLRVRRQPDPWETLLGAITEQLIELQRAMEIQRRLIAAFGYRCPATGMRDAPTPAVIAAPGAGPARLLRPRAQARAGHAPLRRGGGGRAARPARPRPAAAALDARDRPVDVRDGRPARPGPLRPRARPATSASSRSSAAWSRATRGRAPTRPRCAGSSSATASGRGSPACT